MLIYVIGVWFTQWLCKPWLSQKKKRKTHSHCDCLCVPLLALTAKRLHWTDRHWAKTRCFTSLMRPPAVRLRRLAPRSLTEKSPFILRLSALWVTESDTSASRSGRLQKVRGLWPQNKNPAVSRSGEETGCVWESENPRIAPQAGLSHEMGRATSVQSPTPAPPPPPHSAPYCCIALVSGPQAAAVLQEWTAHSHKICLSGFLRYFWMCGWNTCFSLTSWRDDIHFDRRDRRVWNKLISPWKNTALIKYHFSYIQLF